MATPGMVMSAGYNIDSDNGRKVVAIGCFMSGLATLTVGLRLAVRQFERIGIGLDDVTIVLTLLMIWGATACMVFMWHNGLGLHVTEVPPMNLQTSLRGLYAFELFYIADFGLCKVSILLFYQRVFSVTRQRRRIIYGLIAFMVFFTFVFEIVFVFQCSPLHYFWDRVLDPKGVLGTCMNPLVLYGVYTGINILTDLIIWLYPLPILLKLQVSLPQKIGLIVVFTGGALVCIVSIIRATTIPSIVSKDFTYDDVDAAIWALVECPVACIVACLPTLRVLFTRSTLRQRKSSSYGISGGSSGRPSNYRITSGNSGSNGGSNNFMKFKKGGGAVTVTRTISVSGVGGAGDDGNYSDDGLPLSPYAPSAGGEQYNHHMDCLPPPPSSQRGQGVGGKWTDRV